MITDLKKIYNYIKKIIMLILPWIKGIYEKCMKNLRKLNKKMLQLQKNIYIQLYKYFLYFKNICINIYYYFVYLPIYIIGFLIFSMQEVLYFCYYLNAIYLIRYIYNIYLIIKIKIISFITKNCNIIIFCIELIQSSYNDLIKGIRHLYSIFVNYWIEASIFEWFLLITLIKEMPYVSIHIYFFIISTPVVHKHIMLLVFYILRWIHPIFAYFFGCTELKALITINYLESDLRYQEDDIKWVTKKYFKKFMIIWKKFANILSLQFFCYTIYYLIIKPFLFIILLIPRIMYYLISQLFESKFWLFVEHYVIIIPLTYIELNLQRGPPPKKEKGQKIKKILNLIKIVRIYIQYILRVFYYYCNKYLNIKSYKKVRLQIYQSIFDYKYWIIQTKRDYYSYFYVAEYFYDWYMRDYEIIDDRLYYIMRIYFYKIIIYNLVMRLAFYEAIILGIIWEQIFLYYWFYWIHYEFKLARLLEQAWITDVRNWIYWWGESIYLYYEKPNQIISIIIIKYYLSCIYIYLLILKDLLPWLTYLQLKICYWHLKKFFIYVFMCLYIICRVILNWLDFLTFGFLSRIKLWLLDKYWVEYKIYEYKQYKKILDNPNKKDKLSNLLKKKKI